MSQRIPGIDELLSVPEELRRFLEPMKENIEELQGLRGNIRNKAVTYQDLIDLELITSADLPE